MDSLKKRYIFKLFKSCIDFLINILILLFVPRALGPEAYGSFNFIRDSFKNILNLSDLNLGSAHINYAARNENSNFASNVYFSYTTLVGVVLLLFILFINLIGFSVYIFPQQDPGYLFMGALLAYLMYIFNGVMGLSDSKGITSGFEIRSIFVSIFVFLILVIIYLTDNLNLKNFFIQRIVLYIMLLLFGAKYLYQKGYLRLRFVNLNDHESRVIITNFISFSQPLIILSFIGILFSFFDRWFMQIIYGSVSQGYFSLAFTLSSISSLFLAPMVPLLMQSIAISDEKGNLSGIQKAFDNVKIIYLIGALLSLFFFFHSTELINLIGGEEYKSAKTTVLIMSLYPLHVVYGQFCGGVLIALRKTKLYRDISLVSSFLGVIITYFLLAPGSFFIPGLELNSMGLALKFVLVQFSSVTLQLYFVSKIIDVNFTHYLRSQFIILIPIFIIGILENFLRNYFGFHAQSLFGNMLDLALSISLWILLIGLVFWKYPRFLGFEKDFLRDSVYNIFTDLKKR